MKGLMLTVFESDYSWEIALPEKNYGLHIDHVQVSILEESNLQFRIPFTELQIDEIRRIKT